MNDSRILVVATIGKSCSTILVIVMKRLTRKKENIFLFSTDTSLKFTKVFEYYQVRWTVVMYRECKRDYKKVLCFRGFTPEAWFRQPKTFSALHGCILRIKLNLCKSVKSVGDLWVYRIWLPIHPLLYDSLLNVEIDFLEPGTGVEAGTFLVDARQVAMT